jgi:hypothetical protein
VEIRILRTHPAIASLSLSFSKLKRQTKPMYAAA